MTMMTIGGGMRGAEKHHSAEAFCESPKNNKDQEVFTNSLTDREAVFGLARHIALEYFDCGALLLDLRSRACTELDKHQSWILAQLDGQGTIGEVAENYAEAFVLTYEEGAGRVQATCEKLLREQFLRLIRGSWGGDTMDATRYVQNPDVNLREEDEDGALLFNPDTDGVQLLNSTGFYIWKRCTEGRTVSEIVATFKKDFDEVPEDQVTADVEEFLNGMVEKGFIGTLETP